MLVKLSLGKRNIEIVDLPIILGTTKLVDALAMGMAMCLKLKMATSKTKLNKLIEQGAFKMELIT